MATTTIVEQSKKNYICMRCASENGLITGSNEGHCYFDSQRLTCPHSAKHVVITDYTVRIGQQSV